MCCSRRICHVQVNSRKSSECRLLSWWCWNLGFLCHLKHSAVYYIGNWVAFVLETQVSQVQSMLVFSLILLLSYELAHNGVDFTFQFNWIR
ncbi:uncharacterized protein PHALS_10321 [Plasmopara halstedii]|uniref:Uncharacterized protein n=1 Tax=Plasmopara halstedii TaxID=4781 RepID=A0A0P1AGB2_PLAHL|nr:uncharacterized protein PHALS_10321 [Plasmopara halstedii]CEG40103.1 hypothetical protein PHALS_10321 [Plasmopara halstedii]|eukprot:XP_024576472.1 hypothetical protein PHALS_10321 [Plasmopara halstedii]